MQYYREIISPYVTQAFDLIPIIKESKHGNFIRVNIYSKSLFELLTKKIGIPAGRKSHIVLIPQSILSKEKNIVLACVAGIYDAECCIFMDKRINYSKPYPRIDLHMCNMAILNQIKEILFSEGVISSFSCLGTQNARLLIYGESNVKKFLNKVPLKNPKHLNKLKEHGFL